MEFPDLRGLLAVARARGITVALDNTWGAGIALRGFDFDADGQGADVVMQALTKYASGGADVLMGSATTRDEALHQRIGAAHMRLGLGVGANDAELVRTCMTSRASPPSGVSTAMTSKLPSSIVIASLISSSAR